MSGVTRHTLRAQRRLGAAAAESGMSAGSIALSLGAHAAALALLAPSLWSGDGETGIQSVSVTLVSGEPAQVSQNLDEEGALRTESGTKPSEGKDVEPAESAARPLPDPPQPQAMLDRRPETAELAEPPAPAAAPASAEVVSEAVAQVPNPVAPASPSMDEGAERPGAGPERAPLPPRRPQQARRDIRTVEPAPTTPQPTPEPPPQPQEERAAVQPSPAAPPDTPPADRAPASSEQSAGTEDPAPSSLLSNLPTSTAFGSGDRASSTITASRSAKRRYAADLLRHIESHKRYPEPARQRRLEGAVTLSVVVDRAGQLLSAGVAESSAASLLDDAALAVARRAAPYPPMPEGMGDRFAFTVTLRFKP